MEYLHENHLARFRDDVRNCPPTDYQSYEKILLRFINKDISQDQWFNPVPLEESPPRVNAMSDADRYNSCEGFSVSFNNTGSGQLDRFLATKARLIRQKKWTAIVEVQIKPTDGVGEIKQMDYDHVNFHPFADVDWGIMKIHNINL